MNDLEHDLKDLFDAKAHGIGVSPAAPEDVLRRGRRRQIGVLAGGVLGAIAAIVVAGSLAVAMLGHDDEQPANVGPDGPYADRTAVINGFEAHAPAGWTLMDEWPLATVL